MNFGPCHSEHREESIKMTAGACATGSFAWLRMTGAGIERLSASATQAPELVSESQDAKPV
jgi:hypothetical protein